MHAVIVTPVRSWSCRVVVSRAVLAGSRDGCRGGGCGPGRCAQRPAGHGVSVVWDPVGAV